MTGYNLTFLLAGEQFSTCCKHLYRHEKVLLSGWVKCTNVAATSCCRVNYINFVATVLVYVEEKLNDLQAVSILSCGMF